MDSIFLLGVTGGALLVLGSLLPEKSHALPHQSAKNWLFVMGNFFMFLFSLFDYLFQSGVFFFVLLQIIVNIASALMMLRASEKKSTLFLLAVGMVCTVWSLILEQNGTTLLFVAGLIGISLGFVFAEGSVRRNGAFFLGSSCIVMFSYMNEAWIFFWLNGFFAFFSLLHAVRLFFRHSLFIKTKMIGK